MLCSCFVWLIPRSRAFHLRGGAVTVALAAVSTDLTVPVAGNDGAGGGCCRWVQPRGDGDNEMPTLTLCGGSRCPAYRPRGRGQGRGRAGSRTGIADRGYIVRFVP